LGRKRGLRVRRIDVRQKAEIVERAASVEIRDDPGHRARPDLETGCSSTAMVLPAPPQNGSFTSDSAPAGGPRPAEETAGLGY